MHTQSSSLHHRILAELRRQIGAGELQPGDTLPSESELMSRFGVARGTVRQALATLRAEGSVAGPRGRPPIVRDRQLAQPFTHLLSFSAWISSLGMMATGKLIDLAVRPADDEQAAALNIRPGSPIYAFIRVRYADAEPLLIERTIMPPSVGERVARLDLERCSIYAELTRQGLTFASAHQVIDALVASGEDMRLLDVPAYTPLLRVRRRAFSLRGEPLEWSEDRYLAARVSFSLENTPDDAGVSRQLDQSTAGS